MTSLSVLELLCLLSVLSGLLYAAVDDPMTLLPRFGRWTTLKAGLAFLSILPVVFTLLKLTAFQVIAVPRLNPVLNSMVLRSASTGESAIRRFELLDFVILFYAVVVLFLLSRLAAAYFSTVRSLRCARRGELFGAVVYFHDGIRTPLSFGIVRPRVYFPSEAVSSWSARELKLSLAHERIHLQNHDPFWILLSLLVRSCLFFAPWSSRLHRKLELELEVLCDEETCRIQEASVQEYGSLLIRMSEFANHTNVFATNINGSTLQRRILAMKSRKMSRSGVQRILMGFIFFGASAAVTVTAGAYESKVLYNIEAKLFVDGEKISALQIVTQSSKKAIIEQRNDDQREAMRMEVIAEEYRELLPQKLPSEDPISLKFDIEVHTTNKTMHMKPELIVTSGREATVTMAEEDGHSYELKLTTTRKQ